MPANPMTELWASRDLIFLLARRDVRLRYQHAAVGIGWAVIQPLLTMLVLILFQKVFGRTEPGGLPYSVSVMSGMVPWTFLSHSLTLGSSSLLNYYGVINKVYFPRLVLPLAAVAVGSVDFLVALPLIPVLMLYFHLRPSPQLLLLPLLVVLLISMTAALAIWMAILNIRFRDIANALPFLTQLWFFLTPIAYSAEMIPTRWQFAAGINPMVGIIEAFRWMLFGAPANPLLRWWVCCSAVITAVLLVSGVLSFLRHEESLADLM